MCKSFYVLLSLCLSVIVFFKSLHIQTAAVTNTKYDKEQYNDTLRCFIKWDGVH